MRRQQNRREQRREGGGGEGGGGRRNEQEIKATERAPQINTRERAIYVTALTFETVRQFDRWWDQRKHRWKINKSQRTAEKVDEYWRCNYKTEDRYFICGCCVRIRKPFRQGGAIEAARSINIPHRHSIASDVGYLDLEPYPMQTARIIRIG